MKNWNEVVDIINARMSADSESIAEMVQVRNRVEAKYVLPNPSVQGKPSMPPLGAHLVNEAIESHAIRISSVQPTVVVPALDASKKTGPGSVEYANLRRVMYLGTNRMSRQTLAGRRMARHLLAYGTVCAGADYDVKLDRASIVIRDPLAVYPEPRAPEDYRAPENIAFVYQKSFAWLKKQYPDNPAVAALAVSDMVPQTALFNVAEWIDCEHRVVGIIGALPSTAHFIYRNGGNPQNYCTLLSAGENLVERCTFTTGQRVTLASIRGSVSALLPLYDKYDQVMGLWVAAMQKGIFPDKYIIGREHQQPIIVDAAGWQDGRTGRINRLQNVERVGELGGGASPQAMQLLDKLEGNFRGSSGSSELFNGTLNGSVRSGATINSLAGYSIDGKVQEGQEILQGVYSEVNSFVHDINKKIAKQRKQWFFTGTPSSSAMQEVDFDEHLESNENWCDYPFPGADVNQISVALLQSLGARLISEDDARAMSPLVRDAEETKRAITRQELERAALEGVLIGVQKSELPLIDVVAILKEFDRSGDIVKSIMKAQDAAQTRQAKAAEAAGPGMGAPPETMPGLSMPGAGVESLPSIPEPPQGLSNASEMISLLRAQPRSTANLPAGV